MNDTTNAEVREAWARRWEIESEMCSEACAALGLDFDGYAWPTLLSLMRAIAQRARSATNQE